MFPHIKCLHKIIETKNEHRGDNVTTLLILNIPLNLYLRTNKKMSKSEVSDRCDYSAYCLLQFSPP